MNNALEETLEIVRLYGLGYSTKDIGEKLYMSKVTVRNRLIDAGIKLRRTEKTPADKIEGIQALYQKGWGYRKIAKEIGVSRPTVMKYCKNISKKA